MFLNFYGLKQQPFGVTPDARYLYLSNTHREALASLFYGIETGRGFLAMVAKPGMGKTTLLVHLLKKFQSTARTAFLFNTQCNSREFLEALASELGFECSSTNFVQFLEQFNRNLVREARQHRRCIVVIDEAQNLDASVLETARLLSNFETPTAKLLQIVLAGQPQLADKLASPALTQLRQRISIFNQLEPFTPEETGRYIYHRLKLAGYDGPPLFTPDSLAMIAAHAEGVPRSINNLCFATLSLGCALKRKVIDASIVKEVVVDLDVKRLGSRSAPATSHTQDPAHRTHADGNNEFAPPFGTQSPMTFARLLRKLDAPDTDESAGAAKSRAADPVLSPVTRESALDDSETEVQTAESQLQATESAPFLGGGRLSATRLNPMQPPLVADGVLPRGIPSPQIARRSQRGRAEFYLLMGVIALLTAWFYNPLAKIEAASLVQPHQRMQESPRAEQPLIPAALPSNQTDAGSSSTSTHRTQSKGIVVAKKSEIEEL